MKNYKSWLYPGVILLSSSFIVGCVSTGFHDEVVQERDALLKENRSLKSNVKLSRNQQDDMKTQLDSTTAELSVSNDALVDTQVKAMTAVVLYDRLVGHLSAELDSKEITIVQMQSGVNVNLPEGILFDSGSAAVKKTGETILQKVAAELTDVPYQTIVGGFTDNVPVGKRLIKQFPSNWDLAAARATNVVRMLEGSGVPKQRLVSVSFGENQPVASNDTNEGRAQNRRIEIRLRPVVIEGDS